MSPHPTLRIAVPKRETYARLLAELRYLETAVCRALMSETERVVQRKHVTERFRAVLVQRACGKAST